jgi:hypothetical protein
MYPAMKIYHLNLINMSRTCWYRLRKSGGFFCGGTIYFADTVCGSWNQKLYRGEYSGIYSLKLKNSGIYNLMFAPS